MLYKRFQENLEHFSNLINQIPNQNDPKVAELMKRYVEQNILVLNDVFESSIENLERLQRAKSANDVICIQARFTNEISTKLAQSAQRFLNTSLGQISDYNEWLKAHCDLATD